MIKKLSILQSRSNAAINLLITKHMQLQFTKFLFGFFKHLMNQQSDFHDFGMNNEGSCLTKEQSEVQLIFFRCLKASTQSQKEYFQAYNIQSMKVFSIFVLATLACLAISLPFKNQIALLSSLEVGRNQDPLLWSCEGCEADTKPLHSRVIEEDQVKIRAIVSVWEEYTVLAFRYTANLKNIWQDILYPIQAQDDDAPKGCKVQREYDRMWQKIRDDVISDLKKNVKTTRLIITGISLGGGLACLSYIDIKASGAFDNVEVVTFGSPRVGNKKWAKNFDSLVQHTRIYIRRDPIAFLPKCITPICNYRHTGEAYVCYYNKEQCKAKNSSKKQEEDGDFDTLISEIQEHKDELREGDLGGLLDHIYGYKKIRDFDLVY